MILDDDGIFKGYSPLPNCVLSESWSHDSKAIHLYVLLVCNANFKRGFHNLANRVLERGQVYVCYDHYVSLLNVPRSKIKRLFASLEKTGHVSRQKTQRGTVVTMLKYNYKPLLEHEQMSLEVSQQKEGEVDLRVSQQVSQQVSHNKKKNNNNKKNKNNSDPEEVAEQDSKTTSFVAKEKSSTSGSPRRAKYKPKSRKGKLEPWDRKRIMENLTDAQRESLRELCDGDRAYLSEILSRMTEYWTEEDPDEKRDHNHWVNTIRSKIRHSRKKGFEPKPKLGDMAVEMEMDVKALMGIG